MQCILACLGWLSVTHLCCCFKLAVRIAALRRGRLSNLCCLDAVLSSSGPGHQKSQIRQHLIECACVLILEDAA